MTKASVAVRAMAKAARGVGRVGLAELIERDHLAPRSILALMRYGISPSVVDHAATILLAAAIAENDTRTRRRSQAPRCKPPSSSYATATKITSRG
jgi:hypothetical protein